MKLGLALPHYDTSLAGAPASFEGVTRVAQRAEASGFDSVWVSDHLFLDWGKYGGSEEPQAALECFTTMSALSAVTERVRIGSLALCNDLRSPALVAKMAASLDCLSGGRVALALGAGWYEPEYRAADIDFDPPGTRIRRLGEAVDIIRRLLDGEELTFEGRYYTLNGALCRPRPVQQPRPPVLVGGKGDLLLDVAARVADGWNYSWIGSLESYRERARRADEACAAVGRDPATLSRSAGVYVLAGRDDRDLARRFERLLERTPAGVLAAPKGGGGVSLGEFRRSHVAGTVGEVVEELGRLAELGVDEIVVGLGALPFQLADEEDIELVGTEIGPALG
ncbi:LLM class F420-dependent oxidoreductase [soil metagenome]